MKEKNLQDLIEFDGMMITRELYEEIKDSYVPGPTAWEIRVCKMACQAVKEVLFLIDNWVKTMHYTPEASGQELFQKAHKFMNDNITLEVISYDYTIQAQYLEILCGIKDKDLEAKILLLLSKLDDELDRFQRMMYH